MKVRKLLQIGLMLLVPAGLGWYVWSRHAPPPPPDVPLDAAAPEVAEAIRAAFEAVRRQPRSGAAWGELSQLLVAHGYYDQALLCLAQAERLDPGQARWPYLQGSVLLLHSKPRDGIPKLRQALAVARTPDERRAVLFLLGQAVVDDGQLDEADRHFQALRELGGDSAEVHFGRGLLAAARGDRATARAHLEVLADHPSARRQVCFLLPSLVPDAAAAQKYRELATRLPPDIPWPNVFDTEVQRHRVVAGGQLDTYDALMAAGRRDEARDVLRRVAEQSPSEHVCFLLGFALVRAGDYEGAERAFRQVLGFNPRHLKARLFLGAALLEMGEKRAGEAGGAAAARELFRQAVAEEDQALALQRDVALAHLVRGRALARLDRADDALAALREAVLVGPDLPEAHRALGEALLRADRKAEAATHLRDALRLAPEDTVARKLLTEAEASLSP